MSCLATEVSAYTSTKLGERKAEDKKLANPELFFWQRAAAFRDVVCIATQLQPQCRRH